MPQQGQRIASITTPFGPDVVLRRMVATEQLGRPFEYVLDLLSTREIDAEKLLGEPVTVTLEMERDGPPRYFNGIVCRVEVVDLHDRYYGYRAVARPTLGLLDKEADCRVFEKMTVPDIINKMLTSVGALVETKTSGTYERREYCIQYRETDLDFISRLMEQEGIYYYFTHEMGKHSVVLADAIGAHSAFMDCREIAYLSPENSPAFGLGHIFNWKTTSELQSGRYKHSDFNFEKPKDNIPTAQRKLRSHSHAGYQIYDYPGGYTDPSVGSRYAGIRMEEIAAQFERRQGETNERRLHVGSLFTLSGHPWRKENGEYLVVSATHVIDTDEYESGDGSEEPPYRCSFTVIDSKTQYRPPRVTPRPIVQGPQTAIVTGAVGGNEGKETEAERNMAARAAKGDIGTDEYGRVKVQFHWGSTQVVSCLARVAQIWAGKNWGAMFIPRVGQEVIVEFLDGDPDRPIVTGRVYNADNMPPYKLPDEATKATIKSRSTGQGAGFNEIRMDDNAGSEELYFHAEKDMNVVVKNDQTVEVTNDQSVDVKQNILVKAGRQLTLKCGTASIVMSSDGSIAIKGVKVTVEGSASLEAKSATTTVKGTAALNLEASGAAVLKGAVVKIN